MSKNMMNKSRTMMNMKSKLRGMNIKMMKKRRKKKNKRTTSRRKKSKKRSRLMMKSSKITIIKINNSSINSQFIVLKTRIISNLNDFQTVIVLISSKTIKIAKLKAIIISRKLIHSCKLSL